MYTPRKIYVINFWTSSHAEAVALEEKFLPKEIDNQLREDGVIITFGVGTYLTGKQVHLEVDESLEPLAGLFEEQLVRRGYTMYYAQPTVEKLAASVVTDWYNLSQKERDDSGFLETEYVDLIKYHNSFGQAVRNNFDLWQNSWNPEIVDGADVSPQHPDNLSMNALRLAWKTIKGIEEDWNA